MADNMQHRPSLRVLFVGDACSFGTSSSVLGGASSSLGSARLAASKLRCAHGLEVEEWSVAGATAMQYAGEDFAEFKSRIAASAASCDELFVVIALGVVDRILGFPRKRIRRSLWTLALVVQELGGCPLLLEVIPDGLDSGAARASNSHLIGCPAKLAEAMRAAPPTAEGFGLPPLGPPWGVKHEDSLFELSEQAHQLLACAVVRALRKAARQWPDDGSAANTLLPRRASSPSSSPTKSSRTRGTAPVEERSCFSEGGASNKLEGIWRHRDEPGSFEAICDGCIQSANGGCARLEVLTPTSLAVWTDGRRRVAKRCGDDLVWDDGDVWELVDFDAAPTTRRDNKCSVLVEANCTATRGSPKQPASDVLAVRPALSAAWMHADRALEGTIELLSEQQEQLTAARAWVAEHRDRVNSRRALLDLKRAAVEAECEKAGALRAARESEGGWLASCWCPTPASTSLLIAAADDEYEFVES